MFDDNMAQIFDDNVVQIFDDNMAQFFNDNMAKIFDKNMAQNFRRKHRSIIWWLLSSKYLNFDPWCRKTHYNPFYRQKTQNWIHVVVKKVEIWSMLSSRNSKLDPFCRRKIKFRSVLSSKIQILSLSMLRRYSTLLIHGLTSKFPETYVEVTSNMNK